MRSPQPSADIASLGPGGPGPNPLVRALVGLLLGAAAGIVAALVTPRPDRARRPTRPSTSVGG